MFSRLNLGKTAAVLSFLAFVLSGAFIKGKPLLAVATALGVSAFGWYVGRKHMPLGQTAKVILLSILASYPLVLFNNDLSAGYYHGGMVLASFGVACGFLAERTHRLVFWTLVALLAYYAVFFALTGSPEGVFIGSRNRISTLFISLSAFLFVLRKSRSDLAIATAVFLASVSAVGSSGIIVSGILLIAVFLRSVVAVQRRTLATKAFMTAVGVSVVVLIATFVPTVLDEEGQQKLRVERLTGDDVRYQVLRTYAEEHLRGSDLFTGVPLSYSFSVISENGELESLQNLHNSYLDLHSKTGIFAIVIVCAIGFRLAQFVRRSPFLALVLIALLTRAFSDTVFILQGTYNFAFYVFFLPLPVLLGPSRRSASGTARAVEARALRWAGLPPLVVRGRLAASSRELLPRRRENTRIPF